MKRYQNWLATLGLFALTPALMQQNCDPGSGRTRRPPPIDDRAESFQRGGAQNSRQAKNENQRMAEAIAHQLQSAQLGDEEFQVEFQNGVVTLVGPVSSARKKEIAEKVTKKVRGVRRVENRLEVSHAGRYPNQSVPAQQPPNQVIPAQGTQPANAPRRGAVQQTSALMAPGGEPIQAPPGDGVEVYQPTAPGAPILPAAQPSPGAPIQQMPAGYPSVTPPPYVPTNVPVPPGHASGGSYPGGYPFPPVYDQPNLPNYAWPTYANYPNYAQVAYPKQYSASAFPYIGPFHPYPQVPLGWRRVQLEWDDGYWQLNFRPRTEKWWWFMDPRNWD